MNTEGEGAPKYQPAPAANKLPRLANPPTTLWNIQRIFLICSQYFNYANCSVELRSYFSQSLIAWGQAMQLHRGCLQNINSQEPNQDSWNQQGEMSSSLTNYVMWKDEGWLLYRVKWAQASPTAP